jgi:hypothetical protein
MIHREKKDSGRFKVGAEKKELELNKTTTKQRGLFSIDSFYGCSNVHRKR